MGSSDGYGSGNRFGLWRLVRRILDARRGDVRAMEDVYHLRGVLNFVLVFAATIVLPGLMLAYYGVAGIQADELASAAALQRKANNAGDLVKTRVEEWFQGFEDAANNRLKNGQSVFTSQAALSPALRVAFRFDGQGNLLPPFLRQSPDPDDVQELLFFPPWQEAQAASRVGDHARAALLYQQAARQAQTRRALASALYLRARELGLAGDNTKAEALFRELLAQHGEVRETHGFRLGDLARLRLGIAQTRGGPNGGGSELVALVDELLAAPWTIGYGGEAAVVRRAVEELGTGADPSWSARVRSVVAERSSQLYWAGELYPELETLGARGRLLRGEEGRFSYFATDGAVWAMTWTDREQYAFALELAAVVRMVGDVVTQVSGPEGDVTATLLPPDSAGRAGALARVSFSPWLPGYSVAVHSRDPEGLSKQRAGERTRGLGIIALSVGMIVIGAALSARLVQRELDAARDKSDFAAHVSHELRSPITQIRLKAEALQLGLATDDASRDRHYDVIVREAERLSRLVDNVLDFAAIERGRKKYTFRPGDLGATVARTVEAAKVSMELRGMDVDLELPDDLPVVWHDAEAVSQVLHNLLSNAAKYGQEAGWVKVVVRVVDEDAVEVDVADGGIGIAPDEQRQIFEQYYRSSDPNARRRKGTGIGLTIVKYIMEAHGGRVGVRSSLGQGSTFTLQFPTKPPHAERAGA